MATYYAAPNGGGSGASQSSPATLAGLWSVVNPGDQVWLLDGLYRGPANMINPPQNLNGQSGHPITIGALNDGQALLDGEFALIPIWLRSSSWWVIEGLDAKNGAQEVLRLDTGSNNNIFRRLVLWDAHIGKNISTVLFFDSGNNLLENAAIFGTGHMHFQNFGASSTNNVLRLVWARYEGTTSQAFATTLYTGYGFYPTVLMENVLATYSAESMPETYSRTDTDGNVIGPTYTNYENNGPDGLFSSFSGQPAIAAGFRLYGSLAYVKSTCCPGRSGPLYLVKDLYDTAQTLKDVFAFVAPGATSGPANGLTGQIVGFHLADMPAGSTANGANLTSVRPNGSGIPPFGGDYFGGNWSFSNVAAGTILAAVPSPWTATSIGANLCYRYINGVKTPTPLWPWPMNDRIKAATDRAGRYSGPCPSCSGGRSERIMTDVTAEIESILGPIPSECSSSVGSPPGTGGSARGVSGVDTVNRSEFVALDSGQRLINVSDTDLVTDRVRFPFTVPNPSDTSEAGNRGHALTWLVDASQVIGTGLAEADLRYADLDVEVLDPTYQARLIDDPVVTRELMDTFWGITEVSTISITLANADGRLTPLYAADPRDETIILRRLDYRSGQIIDELNARITAIALGEGTVVITATSPDLSVLERELPAVVVTKDAYPNAVDVGAVIPVVFGQVAKLPLPYVKETTSAFEYLVGHGTLTVNALYYIRTDNTYTKIPPSEYEVSTALYPGYTAIRFASRRMDTTTGSLLQIVADVVGPIRHFIRAIEELLVGDNAWGLNGSAGPINQAAFDAAAGDLDQVVLYCDGVLREKRQVQDILRDLMMVRGIRLAFTSTGEWTVSVDNQRISASLSVADGRGDGGRTILSAGQRRRPSMDNAISTYLLRYRQDYVRGVFLGTRQRTVNASFGRNRSLDHPFIRDHETADKVIDYLARRERFGAESIDLTVTQEGRALLEGDLVEVTDPSLGFDHEVLEVRRAAKRLQAIDLELASWSDEIYVYEPEPLPTDVITDEGDGAIAAPTNIQGQVIDCDFYISWNHVIP